MRRFFSYGPVDCRKHFCVPRKELIERCMVQLVGEDGEFGHYFTVWAPRQTGKTWLMRQVKSEIEARYGDRFTLGMMSMQGVVMEEDESIKGFLNKVPKLFRDTFSINLDAPPNSWEDFQGLFHREIGVFKTPVILFIDEFDSLPSRVIDQLVTLFRDIYLNRDNYLLHGLALIGIRAVLGVESERGSPFNIQRSLHVENFTKDEVYDLYNQYIEESDQKIEDEVIESVYRVTRGQPGLVCWFGELLTEKYNPGKDKVIDIAVWEEVYYNAVKFEWNNTILNILKKAKGRYLDKVLRLFQSPDLEFNLRSEWCSYLYLNGVIDYEDTKDVNGKRKKLCIFSSPFVQDTLYEAFTLDMVGEETPIYALRIGDDLRNVFEGDDLNLPALIDRYRDYLKRLKDKGLSPFKEQPKRSDLNIYESGGHFHLYHWLMNALSRRCSVSPEFPTGNGRVDIHLRCDNREGVIEIKSFKDMHTLEQSIVQASRYAEGLNLRSIVLVVFLTGVEEDEAMQLKAEKNMGDIMVYVEPVVI